MSRQAEDFITSSIFRNGRNIGKLASYPRTSDLAPITTPPNLTDFKRLCSPLKLFSIMMNDSQFKDFETQPIDFDPVLHAPPLFEPPKPPEPP